MNNDKRLALSIFWLGLGALLFGLSLAKVLDSSVYAGMGGGLMGVGALQLMRNLKYRRDPDYRERVDTEARDERTRFLHMKSWSWTGYVVTLAEAVGTVVAMALGQRTIQLVLSWSVCLMLIVYWITYVILSKRY